MLGKNDIGPARQGGCFLVILLAVTLSACREPAPAPPAEPPGTLSVLYTCDTRGHMNPCNCTAGVAGGLARRKTYIDGKRTPDAVLVDAGNVTSGPHPWELLELKYILKGYQAMGYDAVNAGAREVSLDAEALRTLRDEFKFFVSANVEDESGRLIFEPFRVVRLPNGFRVGITGVVENTLDSFDLGKGVRIAPPADAIARVLPDLQKNSDFIILLAFVDEASMKALAERFFEIRVIIGGDVQQPSGTPLEAGHAKIAYVTDKGKAVGVMNLQFVDGHPVVADNTIATLLDNVPDAPDIVALVKELEQKQVENNYPTTKDDEEGLSRVPNPE